MSGAAVEIQSDRLLRLLDTLSRSTADASLAMDAVGQYLAARSQLCFEDARDPWGEAWAPLRPSTVARRRKGKGGAPDRPLRDTDLLMGSVGHRAGKDHVTVGTNVVYATTHQFGAPRGRYGATRRGAPIPWGDVPARPFLPVAGGVVELPDEWEREIADLIRAHFEENQ